MRLRSSATFRALKDQSGLTYSDIATNVGCSRAFPHQLASGRSSGCGRRLARRIAATFGVPLEVLFVESAYDEEDEAVSA